MDYFTDPRLYDTNCRFGLENTPRNQALIGQLRSRKRDVMASDMKEKVDKINHEMERSQWEHSGDWIRKSTRKKNEEMRKEQQILAQDHLTERRKILAMLLDREQQMFQEELLQMGYVILKKR
ncbi:hypothetical protein CDAR_187251 [Caerostris darwini]|uniref:Uncharacterized protein n=1 Tax=Caerostris darwini TaxID=1538125 RepID=A0AAV4NAY9_9ARAC|nr:hypothetical protein CDAR_187251 [Caerostris darwini]